MRRPLTAPNQRDIAEREPSRLLEPAERNVLDEREDVALEGGEVDEAKLLGVGRGTAYEAVRQGEIPAIRIGRRVLVPRARLLELLGESETPAARPDDSDKT
jgi:excisionase family DNA binding protein